jgi:type II secretory pathway pseudopilin PulG
MNRQSGQSLIETLVAAFVLVMGISAALGLATYSLSATTNIRNQTVALGLAREGIEVVKNMRDTNWLRGTLSTDCENFMSGAPAGTTSPCIKTWLSSPYNLSPTSGKGLSFNPAAAQADRPWDFTGSYGLDLAADPKTTKRLFISGLGNSGFFRKIMIDHDTLNYDPYESSSIGPRVKVTSIVWWNDNKCGESNRPDVNVGDPCSITLETYLTNWRTF